MALLTSVCTYLENIGLLVYFVSLWTGGKVYKLVKTE